MESDKLNWMQFGAYMNGESTPPDNLDQYFRKVFDSNFLTINESNFGKTIN